MGRHSRRGARGPLGFRRRSRLSRAVLAVKTVGWLSWRLIAIAAGELWSRSGGR
jgi:hypothetical protein